ncbi:hypothetical protein QO003_002451 [Arthrobacter silviterrae]|uniref:DUF2695 domain-containing protein n=1 Tax=Arthrobacter silviterrae TaxID=2026658 RepID=A0ABX0DBV1_9MICC|nr:MULTISPECIES: DUF2695 domain-containing protein [Arthrobacter]MCU6481212.1 DUF2695 domain-containing protein [Arthrobacter sp. A2-55]MDQ0278148.1 hypothetical protein [Arthrobacter silviterrae]NGN84386.1 DUF2695 domain-containing protein [Arthrobacter silviterrae]
MESELPIEVQRELAELGVDLTRILENECLFCYVYRMVELHGCFSFQWAQQYLDIRAPRSRGTLRKLEACGGFCDCEIIMNVVSANEPLWNVQDYGDDFDGFGMSEPEDKPPCHGVGTGSVSPCALWDGRGAFRRGSYH